MKRAILALAVAALLLFVGTSPLRADGFILRFDENCNGTVSTDGGLTYQPAPCSLMSDPTPGGVAGNVVTYLLPNFVITGDVGVLENGSNTELSDVLSFTNAAGDLSGNVVGDRMIFYSLLGEGKDLAETSFPT